ncbi:MAG: SPOR domain-containing protein [Aureispira sp.]|nr:SPOR domain-containing protein [Aureispira sp.]
MRVLLMITTLCTCLLVANRGNTQSIKTTYKIRIAAMSQAFDKAMFSNLKELGVLMYEPADNGYTRVYLGMYMGKTTAKRILSKVKHRGYKTAYLVQDTYIFQSVDNEELTHTLQFSAVKRLNVVKVVESLRRSGMHEDFYIWYNRGYYRLSLGLLVADNIEAAAIFKTAAVSAGYEASLLRQFREPTKEPVVIEAGTLNDAVKP